MSGDDAHWLIRVEAPAAYPRRPELAANTHDTVRIQLAATCAVRANQLFQAENRGHDVDLSGDTHKQHATDQPDSSHRNQHARGNADLRVYRQYRTRHGIQEAGTDDQAHGSGQYKRSVGCRLELDRHEPHSSDDQRHSKPVRRQ